MRIIDQIDYLLREAAKLPDGTSAIFYAATLKTRKMSEAEAVESFKAARKEALKLLPKLQ